MSDEYPSQLPIHALRRELDCGSTTAVAIAKSCLDRIEARDGSIRAWAHLDPERVLAQAATCDASAPLGPLHGIPVGVKDVIDTRDALTEYGTPIYAGHQPRIDAACVALLRDAGSVILGKTRTTELACVHPTVTVNPHDLARSPGGSSSGSAAAVADFMTPWALGTQTFGSVIRPASFCGIVGFKPTFGSVSRAGVKSEAESLDTVGCFCRTARDLPLAFAGLTGEQPSAYEADHPNSPRILISRGPGWDLASPETVETLTEAAERFREAGATVLELRMSEEMEAGLAAHHVIACREMVRAFAAEHRDGSEHLSAALLRLLDFGRRVSLREYHEALQAAEDGRKWIVKALADADAVLTPAQQAEAPEGLDWTGDPVFNRFWTLIGTPTITLPCAHGPNGMPVGVQLVGTHHGEKHLFAIAAWSEEALSRPKQTV